MEYNLSDMKVPQKSELSVIGQYATHNKQIIRPKISNSQYSKVGNNNLSNHNEMLGLFNQLKMVEIQNEGVGPNMRDPRQDLVVKQNQIQQQLERQ